MGREQFDAAVTEGRGALGCAWAGPFAITTQAMFDQIVELRRLVWCSEPGLINARSYDPEPGWLQDDHDRHGQHWVMTSGDTVVAAARVCVHDIAVELPDWERCPAELLDLQGPVASLNRMVVHPAMRRLGLSSALTTVRLEAARSQGARSVVVEAAPSRVAPLRALGFIELGRTRAEPWDLAPYVMLILRLDLAAR
jgi:GNAT superfamily N-acetyltransferase